MPTDKTRPTLDQRRAQYAWDKTGTARNIEDYTNLAKAVAALVMTSGLMQTLAFLQAKDKPHHQEVRDHICRWLGNTLGGTPVTESERFPPQAAADFATVMAALHQADSALYRRATDESLALLRWIRQFADARKAMTKPRNAKAPSGD